MNFEQLQDDDGQAFEPTAADLEAAREFAELATEDGPTPGLADAFLVGLMHERLRCERVLTLARELVESHRQGQGVEFLQAVLMPIVQKLAVALAETGGKS